MQKESLGAEPGDQNETLGPPLSVEEKIDIIAQVIFKMSEKVDAIYELQLELFPEETN